MAIIRMHAVVAGRVQGVFFRMYTAQEAKRLALSGWVRNLGDGTVETEFQGEENEVRLMAQWLHQGSPNSRVDRVQSHPCPPLTEEKSFVVRH
jgi:acylphosphatase